MHDWYDWVKDIGLPALVGLGSIGVGAVAIVVARQSHELAKQVRKDEAKRDEDAARERYRVQLLSAVESAVAAVLAHRGALWISRDLGGAEDRVVGGTTITRFEMLEAVADQRELRAVLAMNHAFIDANNTDDVRIVLDVLGELALALPRLLAEPPETKNIARRASEWVANAEAKARLTDGGAGASR